MKNFSASFLLSKFKPGFMPAAIAWFIAANVCGGSAFAGTGHGRGKKHPNAVIKHNKSALTSASISYPASTETYAVKHAIPLLVPNITTSGTNGSFPEKILDSGLNHPYGVTADVSGNIYESDQGNNTVKKLPVGGGAPVAIGSGFNAPMGLAADAAGNVYVADYGNNAVKKIPVGGGSVVTLGSGFNGPSAVAVDGAGNVYVADKGNNALKQIAAGGGTTTTLATGFNGPTGVAVDGFGNVYIADSGNGAIKEWAKGEGGVATLVTGQTNPQGVAVDAAGTIYFTTSQANGVFTYVSPNAYSLSLTGITSPANLFADGTGKIEVADAGGHQVVQATQDALAFIDKPLPAGLVFHETQLTIGDNTYNAGAITGAAQAASPATTYTITYNWGGVSATTTITITVNANPAASISYPNSINLYQDINANVVPAETGLGNSLNLVSLTTPLYVYPDNPNAIAVGPSNVLYYTTVDGYIYKYVPGGTPILVASGLNAPAGLAIDASGNIYVANSGDGTIKKVPAGSSVPITFASGFTSPNDVAIDASGNIYVADKGGKAVKKIPAGGGTPIALGSGYTAPVSLKLDGNGNLYIADEGTIYEIAAGSNNKITTNYGSTGNTIEFIAVDAAGNVFVSNQNEDYMALAGSGQVAGLFGAGNPGPFRGITVDASDNFYFFYNNFLYQGNFIGGYFITPATLPAGLSFSEATGAITGVPTTVTPANSYQVRALYPGGILSTTFSLAVVAPPAPAISYNGPYTVYDGQPVTISPASLTNVGVQKFAAPVSVGSGFGAVGGVAIDNSGNIYVSDFGNRSVKKIPAGSNTPVTLASGLNSPESLAVDASGNVYVSNNGNGVVLKIPAGGGSSVNISGTNIVKAQGIAVDASGNVFVADQGSGSVKEILASNGTVVTACTGLKRPYGVAVDAAGDLFVTDNTTQSFGAYGFIYKIAAGTNTLSLIQNVTGYLGDIKLANDGNLYIGMGKGGSVFSIPATGGTVAGPTTTFGSAYDLAIDNTGNVYVADSVNSVLDKLSVYGGIYITPALPAGLSFNNTSGVISGTPVMTKSATYTVTAHNVTANTQASLTLNVVLPPLPTISYPSPENYSTGTPITPLVPTSSNVYAYGYNPVTKSLGSGFSLPAGVTHDSPGNLYIADAGNNAVKEIPVAGGAPITLGSGFNYPAGVAIDPAGNIYVADEDNNAIKKIPAGNGTPVIIGSGFSQPTDVVIDKLGNLFIADAGNNAVKEIPVGSTTTLTLSAAFNHPYSICVDAYDNVYVADAGNNAIKKIPAGGGTPVTVYSASGLYGLAIGTTGNLYFGSSGSNKVMMLAAGSTTPVTLALGFSSPAGMAINGNGVLFVADQGNNAVKQITPSGGFFIVPTPPVGLSFNASNGDITGTPLAYDLSQSYIVTGYNSAGRKTATFTMGVAGSDNLTGLTISNGALSPAFSPAKLSYKTSVGATVSSITVTPTAADQDATVTVNGTTVASGSASGPIALNTGANTISILVTAGGGSPSQTYTITVTRPPSGNAYLSGLRFNGGKLTPTFYSYTYDYTSSVSNATSSITVVATAAQANATIAVNGMAVTSGVASAPIALAVGNNIITTVVTAQDGVTQKTYTMTVSRAGSGNAYLSGLRFNGGKLTPTFYSYTYDYTSSVSNGTSSITVIATAAQANATITVNGMAVTSGVASAPIALAVGDNTITTVATAQDGVTQQTYTITITRASGGADTYISNLGVAKPVDEPAMDNAIFVHQGVSPNGDGINDFLQIDNISSYPNNKLMIMNRNGQIIYEAREYDNTSKVFDGHSSKTGQMQLPGTYFYALDYVVKGVTMHKTGFIVLKY